MTITNQNLRNRLVSLGRAVTMKTSAKKVKSGKNYYSNNFLNIEESSGKVKLVVVYKTTSESDITTLLSKRELYDAMGYMMNGISLKKNKR